MTLSVEMAYMPDESSILVLFSKAVINSAALRAIANWSIAPLDGGMGIGIESVTTYGVDTTTRIGLVLNSGVTKDKSYRVTLASGVVGDESEYIIAPNNTADFFGYQLLPTLLAVVPVSKCELEAYFSHAMDANGALFDLTNYVLTGGGSVVGVRQSGPCKIILTISQDMVADQSYRLDIGAPPTPITVDVTYGTIFLNGDCLNPWGV